MPTASNRRPMVPSLSSAARMLLSGLISCWAVAWRVAVSILGTPGGKLDNISMPAVAPIRQQYPRGRTTSRGAGGAIRGGVTRHVCRVGKGSFPEQELATRLRVGAGKAWFLRQLHHPANW